MAGEDVDGKSVNCLGSEAVDDFKEAAVEETQKYVLLVRNKRSDDWREELEVDSIVIQSPLLKNVLHDVLKDYPGVTMTLSRLIFSAPFSPFVHRWQQLVAALNGDYDEETKSHLELLYDVLYGELKDVIAATEDYTTNKVFGEPVAERLTDCLFTEHYKLGPCYQLRCDQVDFDGKRFGYGTSLHFIAHFEGTIPITELKCFPLSYHPDEKRIKDELIARGRKFELLAGYHYKSYRGRAIKKTPRRLSMFTFDGRIVIDDNAYTRAYPHGRLYLEPLDRVQAEHSNDEGAESSSEHDGEEQDIYDSTVDRRRPLTEEQLLLCTPIIRGYEPQTECWLELLVDSVSDIVFNEDALDSLVLPEGNESLILAIAQAQVKNREASSDVVAGKGQGNIILLSGGHLVAKIRTAESVAEHLRVPLYEMDAGDLGTDPTNVEDRLTRALDMVAKWNAVLLLVGCDDILEARSTENPDRNRIVSIFLRTLENYHGLLFLTTSHVENMDQAFNSRIHFRLVYPDPDERTLKSMWTCFLDRQHSGHSINDEDLDELAKLDLNRFVIRNAVRSAARWAVYDNEMLGIQHIKTVLRCDGHKWWWSECELCDDQDEKARTGN